MWRRSRRRRCPRAALYWPPDRPCREEPPPPPPPTASRLKWSRVYPQHVSKNVLSLLHSTRLLEVFCQTILPMILSLNAAYGALWQYKVKTVFTGWWGLRPASLETMLWEVVLCCTNKAGCGRRLLTDTIHCAVLFIRTHHILSAVELQLRSLTHKTGSHATQIKSIVTVTGSTKTFTNIQWFLRRLATACRRRRDWKEDCGGRETLVSKYCWYDGWQHRPRVWESQQLGQNTQPTLRAG